MQGPPQEALRERVKELINHLKMGRPPKDDRFMLNAE